LEGTGCRHFLRYLYVHYPGIALEKEGDKKRGVESKTSSIFQVELFLKMDSQKKRAYGHVCFVPTNLSPRKDTEYFGQSNQDMILRKRSKNASLIKHIVQ
jgi:hypothetical protein